MNVLWINKMMELTLHEYMHWFDLIAGSLCVIRQVQVARRVLFV